jgi:hypothetical protein
MFNSTELLIDEFVRQLRAGYRRTYGGQRPDYEEMIGWVGAMALENIANSDALYHNVEHSIMVGLVGQEVLRGRHIKEGGVSCDDWLHFIISLVCHDIGYVKGVCRDDNDRQFATGIDGAMIELPEGSTDAALTAYHVDRGKLFISERFGNHRCRSDQAEHGTDPLSRARRRRPQMHHQLPRSAAGLGSDRPNERSPLPEEGERAVL